MRKLVTIQEVREIVPIPEADSIEVVKIMGWQCVAKKGEFKVGDKGVYFEVDSYLPIEERYEFLRGSSYRNNEFMGEGFRIKTMRMRGQLSQGLFLPFSNYPELDLGSKDIGEDITVLLGVRKWEIPEVEGSSGTIIGDKPFGIPTTDELRVQSTELLREKMLGKPYYISTKMDGTSCTMYHKGNKVGVCGRNTEYKDDENCSMWKYAHKHNIPDKLKHYGKNIAIQGEFCGHGIQKNRLKLNEPAFYVFDIINLDTHERAGYHELMSITSELGLNTVPIEEVGECFNYTLEELLEKARGKYPSGLDKEGIVIRPIVPEYVRELSTKLSFKVINNDFLLKEK